jgi:cbb3-type cytochrome oxidase subunit 1
MAISSKLGAAGENLTMPQVAELFFKTAVAFLIVGIAMGLHMSMSGNYDVVGAHAHANLLGWVTSALFGGYYALNPAKAESRLAMIHFWIYTVGVAALVPSLYMLLKGFAAIEPLVALTSLVIFAGIIVFAVIVFRSPVPRAAMTPAGQR